MPAERPPRRAEIVAVGSELLTPARMDTNSLFITERLNALGIEVRVKVIVGDDRDDLAAVVAQALARSDLVVCTGGLGPTDDDVTREVVAGVLGRPLSEDEGIVEMIRGRFAARGLVMPEGNRRQALVPLGARVLANPHGTAPGLLMEHEQRTVLLLPGPPREMQPMLEAALGIHLAPASGERRIVRRVVRVTGRTESHVEEIAQPIYSPWRDLPLPVATTILAAPGQIELHLSVASADAAEAEAALESAAADLRAALGADVFSIDGRSLEEIVGELLMRRGWRIAAAESCTGGLLLARLTDVPGSSQYVECGVVTYSNMSKATLAGVPDELIERHGAVSEPVARVLAAGVRERAGADVGVSITGIAGPGGGSAAKPVGTVAIAAAFPGPTVIARTLWLPGGRAQVRTQAVQAALDLVRRQLLEPGF